MKALEGIRVDIDEREVLRLQRGSKRELSEDVLVLLCEAIAKGRSLIEPKAIYQFFNVKEAEGKLIRLDNDIILNIGSDAWQGSEQIAVALCTIGSALEKRASELFADGDYALALMLDSVGSVAAESVADYLNHVICYKTVGSDVKVGPRLSPGYGAWDIGEQVTVFKLLPGERIGICLNEQRMMIPRKSISFCVGMGKALGAGKRINPCRYCGMKACQYRRSE